MANAQQNNCELLNMTQIVEYFAILSTRDYFQRYFLTSCETRFCPARRDTLLTFARLWPFIAAWILPHLASICCLRDFSALQQCNHHHFVCKRRRLLREQHQSAGQEVHRSTEEWQYQYCQYSIGFPNYRNQVMRALWAIQTEGRPPGWVASHIPGSILEGGNGD